MANGNNKDGKHKFGHRNFKHNQKDVRPESPQPKAPPQPPVFCTLCGKQIFDISSALANKNDATPIHFDCALAQVTSAEELSPSEHVVYIGRGTFAVIESKEKHSSAFTIKRRIQWEKEGEKHDWRKTIQNRVGL